MRKLGLLIAMILCVTIGGVYAAWVYPQSDDVADVTHHTLLTLPDATFSGTYGTYAVTPSDDFAMTIDPEAGTTHTTALYITGSITISFEPNSVATPEVKANGVPTTFQFTLSNDNWTFKGQKIITLAHDTPETITEWEKDNGVFKFTLTADMLREHISLTAFELTSKAVYDEFDTALSQGQINLHVSDGKTSNPQQSGQ